MERKGGERTGEERRGWDRSGKDRNGMVFMGVSPYRIGTESRGLKGTGEEWTG